MKVYLFIFIVSISMSIKSPIHASAAFADSATQKRVGYTELAGLIFTPIRKVTSSNISAIDRHHFIEPNQSVWLHDYYVSVYGDLDKDGYYSKLSMTFDFDTLFIEKEIFVDVSLVSSGGDSDLILSSQPFFLFEYTDADSLQLEIDLAEGFMPDNYNIVIEIFDTASFELLAQYNNQSIEALSFRSLESDSYDNSYGDNNYDNDLSVETAYQAHTDMHAGSFGEMAMFIICSFLCLRSIALTFRQATLSKTYENHPTRYSSRSLNPG